MPLVTGTLTDIGLEDLSGSQPVLVFTPSEGAANGSGGIFPTKPVEVAPNSDGYFSAELASTDGIRPASAHWRLTIKWASPDGYGNGGYTATDALKWKIRVPTAGGRLADMIDARPATDSVYIGNEPPADGTYTYWIDTSTTPATLNEWSA